MNMIQNALQAMNYQGSLEIKSSVNPTKDYVVIQFKDKGPGIPEHLQEDIFKPFFTTKPQGEGSGLGLSFIKKTIDKHQGSIQVSSKPGETIFTIELPINFKKN
jgi:signal transduction histidine kinase